MVNLSQLLLDQREADPVLILQFEALVGWP